MDSDGAPKWERLLYPTTRRSEQIDNYHGADVADPYRWLEDDNSAETAAWVAAQNQVTRHYLDNLPQREQIRTRLGELWNYPRSTPPFKRGNRYFFFRNDGLQNQSVFYAQPLLDSVPEVVLDPNLLSEDGTIALGMGAISYDGSLLAYGLTEGGSDWHEIRVRDIETGTDLPDLVRWIKFSTICWTNDGKGFFYARFPEPTPEEALVVKTLDQKLYYHRIGTDQSQDELIFELPDNPDWFINSHLTDDGRYLILNIWRSGRETLLYYFDLHDPLQPLLNAPAVALIDRWEAGYSVIGNDGTTFYINTDLDAPHGQIISINIDHPAREQWRMIIPECDDVIEGVSLVQDRFIVTYMHNAYNQVRLHDLDGRFVQELPLPGIGSVAGASGRREDREIFYIFTSFLYPGAIFRYDMASGANSLFYSPHVDFNPDEYEIKQEWYTSKDGTSVPMFITHRKGLAMDGKNPTWLFGYGGFNVSLTPYFSPSNLLWLQMGGVYALPSLRGGGEFGQEWHRAGTLERKQNTFDDFIAAAEYLIAQGYTSPAKLAIEGGSNGGLLVGAVICQRPDLFAVALPGVGVLDMLRYHKFTVGMTWRSDYGISDNPEEFATLYSYSPLHNLQPGTRYPATLVSTADHDDRVVPAHSFKFAAELQQCHAGERPVLLRVTTNAGHGAGKPITMALDEMADTLAFMVEELVVSG